MIGCRNSTTPQACPVRPANRCTALRVLRGGFLWLATVPAFAFDAFEFQVYGYRTVGEGRISPQLLNSFVASGFREGGMGTSDTYPSEYMLRTAIEYEFGLTPKIDFAYYLNLAHPNGSPVQLPAPSSEAALANRARYRSISAGTPKSNGGNLSSTRTRLRSS